ncbi:MAG: VOC family protein [Pseudomonadota bacterium]
MSAGCSNHRDGAIVWHDLLTDQVDRARRFYADLFGWQYLVEHASDFAWRPGQTADYPLIISKQAAHGGFVDPDIQVSPGWLAYVAVNDVAGAAERARILGARIEREPFDVPGVGRSALICDPWGARICAFSPTHHFPPPSGVFVWDQLITSESAAALHFYQELFGWSTARATSDRGDEYGVFKSADATPVAVVKQSSENSGSSDYQAQWISCMAVGHLDHSIVQAVELGAALVQTPDRLRDIGHFAILKDPVGARFGLVQVEIGGRKSNSGVQP